MTEIKELLAKLKELDPETWDRYIDLSGEYPATRQKKAMYLLCVIQDAIAANDNFIGFEITYTSYFDVKYEAEIFGQGLRWPGIYSQAWDQTGEILRGFGETAAEAIMAAYVKALEAEHGRR